MPVKVTSAPFNFELDDDNRARITRDVDFSNGDKVNFTITLDRDDEIKLSDMHRRSVAELIRRLQEWVDGEST